MRSVWGIYLQFSSFTNTFVDESSLYFCTICMDRNSTHFSASVLSSAVCYFSVSLKRFSRTMCVVILSFASKCIEIMSLVVGSIFKLHLVLLNATKFPSETFETAVTLNRSKYEAYIRAFQFP